jgi:hypothetical protein
VLHGKVPGIRYGGAIWMEVSSREAHHPTSLGALLLGLACIVAYLAEPRGLKQCVKVFAVSLEFLLALMGLGVFGKTLGDFLRNVNG